MSRVCAVGDDQNCRMSREGSRTMIEEGHEASSGEVRVSSAYTVPGCRKISLRPVGTRMADERSAAVANSLKEIAASEDPRRVCSNAEGR